ncbi:MAG: hypothetical protein IID07_16395 [Gemmatimonadetes bacterium]|nr:hypothetical protein [Gemmatimonadota bacterium]
MSRKLRGVGYHSEKRSGVRDSKFRALPPKIQEELAGTSYETLRGTYDYVSPEEMREAMDKGQADRKAGSGVY